MIAILVIDPDGKAAYIQSNCIDGEDAANDIAVERTGRYGFITKISTYTMPEDKFNTLGLYVMDAKEFKDDKEIKQIPLETLIEAERNGQIKDIVMTTMIRDYVKSRGNNG